MMEPMTLTITGATVKHRGCKGPLHCYRISMKHSTVGGRGGSASGQSFECDPQGTLQPCESMSYIEGLQGNHWDHVCWGYSI